MKVAELIKVLERCRPDDDVFVAYDSMACIVSLEPDQIVEAEEANYSRNGVWLCAMEGHNVQWHIEDGTDGRLKRVSHG